MNYKEKNEYFRCPGSEADYCRKCWIEFTTLTEEEMRAIYPEENFTTRKYTRNYSFIFENTGQIFTSVNEASKVLNISRNTIYALLRGYSKNSKKGYVFKYI